MKYFLIIGTLNCVTYKDVFPSVKSGEVWFGHNKKNMIYNVPDSYPLEGSSCGIDEKGRKWIKVTGVRWFTNLKNKPNPPLQLTEHYSLEKYKHYDNYEAIEVGKVTDIPCDYDGIMGVPLSFIDKYCPEQFEIIGEMVTTKLTEYNFGYPYINGKKKFARILIKKRG